MRLFDQARAITRLVLFNNERDTISEQAKHAADAARREREQTKMVMDELLSSLVRQRIEKGIATSQSTAKPIHK